MKIFIALLLISQMAFAKGMMLDRVVVEVNSVSYTQRQIELFYCVFQAISLEGERTFEPVSKENWQKILSEFINFMLIEQEAHRLGSYLPSANMIERGIEIFNRQKSRDEKLFSMVLKLQANERSIRQSIVSVLRVASFLRSKKRRTSPADKMDANLWLQFHEEDWFLQLSRRGIVRYMSDGLVYKKIKSL